MPDEGFDKDQKVLGDNIRRLREEAGMTATELSIQAGITASKLSVIENGEGNPQYRTICSLARALKVEPSDLMIDREREKNKAIINMMDKLPPDKRLAALAGIEMLLKGACAV